MVLREANDPLNQSRGIMGPLANSAVQNNKGRLRQRFDLIRKLGQGTYGKVQLGIDKETGQEVAIKTIKKSKIETEADLIRIRREIQIMSSVRHPNIIHIYEVFENREKMVLVMEYAAGGELYDYLNDRKILQEDEARRIFRQIASAVYYCHKHKICHRDLKLENILLDEKANAKIADFGLSNVFDDINLLKTFCGSPLYASPEIVRGTPYYGPEVDCWSLGVLLYTLVYGAMPFDGSNFKRLVKQISNGDYYEPKKPAEASLLIRRMLTVDPLKRASIKDVCSHQWINQGFDTPCLANAEELANQTPVRLDLLLSVAPAYNINHSQVVIACDQNEDKSQMDLEMPSTSDAAAVAGEKPSTKPKKDLASSSKNAEHHHHGAGAGAVVAPFDKPARSKVTPHQQQSTVPVKVPLKEVKKKPVAKKKSKSSPVLELIVDVEEEEPQLECIDDGDDEEDAGDTLSEISEIQTIAEDVKEAKEADKSKSKLKEEPKPKQDIKEGDKDKEKKKLTPTTKITIVEDKGKQNESTEKEPPQQKEKEKEKTVETTTNPTVTNKSKVISPTVVASTTKTVPTPVATTTQAKTGVVETSNDDKTEAVKAKVKVTKSQNQEKPKEEIIPIKVTPEAVETKVETPTTTSKAKEEVKNKEKVKTEEESKEKPVVESSENQVVPPTKPPTVVKKKLVKKSVKAADDAEKTEKTKGTLASSSSSIASSGGEKSGTKLDEGKSTETSTKAPKLRPRSDSNSSDASPTRIERRSSKIISQKTAELIQNLETKTSTSSTDSGKNKKLVFPSLKVSDAKRAFEKPPKPVTVITPSKPLVTKTTTAKPDVKPKLNDVTTTKVEKEKEKPTEVTELTVKSKKPKSKSPSPCPDNEKIVKKIKDEDVDGDGKLTETKTVTSGKKSPNVQRKADTSTKVETEKGTPVIVENKENIEKKEKTVADKEISKTIDVKEQPESELKVQQRTTIKQNSASPKPEKKIIINKQQVNVESGQSVTKPISPVPAAVKTPISPLPMSPEPDTETTQTVSDDLNTEIDMSVSEFSVSEVPKQPAQKSTAVSCAKPIKKLKLKINTDNQGTSEQLLKPVFVDSGHGPPRQAVMLMSGKTTPPVKSSHDVDSSSISTDPFFSQSESVSMNLSKDKVAPKKAIPQNKEQAVKKISSVISRISSSESNERLINDDKTGKVNTTSSGGIPNKIIKTQVEKFVQAPGDSGKVFKTQRSEVSFPVAAAQSQERIIPIKFAEDIVSSSTPPLQGQTQANILSSSSKTHSAPNIGVSKAPSRVESTKKTDGSSSTIFSRQNSSDTESSIAPPCKPEPIRKSPREFIIPIKIETSGQTVTPKEDFAAEASNAEDPFRMDSRLRSGRFGRHKRYSSLLSDSSLEEEPAPSVSASTSRRSSTSTTATAPSHARSHSLGDQPETEPTTPLGTFKRYRMRRAGVPLDRSDSFSSAEEDEEDAFEVLTAESLFSNLLDRVRNLTKRLNRDDGPTPNWPGPESPSFGLWGTSSPFREFMSRAPSETRSYVSSTGPASVTVTISTGPGRRSLSREMSGDSDSVSVGLDSSFPSRGNLIQSMSSESNGSGSIFQSRGSFGGGGGDNAETCTVRSLPVNLGSNRRSQFLTQRSEPRGLPDRKISTSGLDGVSSPLGIGTYNPPTARPYNRTMSNAEYTTSVTLPFRRSLKAYDRPSGYNFQNDYSPISSQASHLNNSSDHPYLSGTTPHYALPHRSNSVISSGSSSRYGSSSSAGGSSVMGGGYGSGTSTGNYGSNLASDSQLNSPYSNRYSRSLSRARATPDPDISPSRFRRDVSTPRQLDNLNLNITPTDAGGGGINSNSTTRSSVEPSTNGWVGGASSTSIKTAAAATAKMTTQEKMNNYQNYYQSLSQHPTRRLHVPDSPALANYDYNNYNANGFHDLEKKLPVQYSGRESVDRVSDVPTGGTLEGGGGIGQPRHYDVQGMTGTNSNVSNFSPYRFDTQRSTVGQPSSSSIQSVGVHNSVLGSSGSRELSSPPMLNNTNFSREHTPSFTNNNNCSNSSITSIPKCWPNVAIKPQTHLRPVNVSNFLDHSNVSGITNSMSVTSPPVNSTVHSNSLNMHQNQNQFTRLASPQPHHQQQSLPLSVQTGTTLENGEGVGLKSKSMSSNESQHYQQTPKRDARQAEKITCFLQRPELQRKSVSRDLASPPPIQSPPIQSYQMTTNVIQPTLPIENSKVVLSSRGHCESPPIPISVPQQDSQQQTQQNEEEYVDPNSSVDKSKSISSQKMSKPKFLQSLEKKWEKLTTGTTGIGNNNNASSNLKGGNENVRKDKGSSSMETINSREQVVDQDDDGGVMSKLDSESSLLQRAVSPEKKPKSKFGSSTVNFMLGKFRRFEENSGTGVGSNVSKTTGKPPSALGTSNNPSRIGRRVQSVYAGACSDSVLTLPSHLTGSRVGTGTLPPTCNSPEGCVNEQPVQLVKNTNTALTPSQSQSLIRKSQPIQSTGSGSGNVVGQTQDLFNGPEKCVKVNTSEIENETTDEVESSKTKISNKLRRPLSLGIFSNNNNSSTATGNNSTSSSSYIPRFTRQNVAAVAAAAAAEAESGHKFPVENVITTVNHSNSNCQVLGPSSPPPQINVIPECKASTSTDEMDGNPLTPTSISDSFDSSSVCSEKTEMSLRSVLDGDKDRDRDGCESVSERIFRKSFYPRFNSLDRKNRSASVSSSSPRHYSPKPSSTSGVNITSKKTHRSSLSPSAHPENANTSSNSMNNNCVGGIPSNSSGSSNNNNNGKMSLSKINDSESSVSCKINKYNPNPLFKELITDEYKSDVGRKAEYSRRVTSKLSKLLREIESDIGNRSSGIPKKEPSVSPLKSSQSISASSNDIDQMKLSSRCRDTDKQNNSSDIQPSK